MSTRNRSQGWIHAKRSGHKLEEVLARELVGDREQSTWLYKQCYGDISAAVPEVHADGIAALWGACILGGHTPAKADIHVRWSKQRTAKISLKKSASGQVWLVSLERFVAGFEAHYGAKVPEPVQHGLRLFIGRLSDHEMSGLLRGGKPSGPIRSRDGVYQEVHQGRFVSKTLLRVAPEAWAATLNWFRLEMPRITELCFARGLCAEDAGQAEFVWYHLIDETSGRLIERRVVRIDALIEAIAALPLEQRASVGRTNGGSTIVTPFGFLQMHGPKKDNLMQFHHQLRSVKALVPGD